MLNQQKNTKHTETILGTQHKNQVNPKIRKNN